MNLCDKLEILIRRSGCKKTEFADKIGITYRALANYMNEARKPKTDVLELMAKELGVEVAFLTDNAQSLVLSSEERFIFNSTSNPVSVREASDYLERTRELFGGDGLSEDDKQALFSCVAEVYFDAKNKAKKNTAVDTPEAPEVPEAKEG